MSINKIKLQKSRPQKSRLDKADLSAPIESADEIIRKQNELLDTILNSISYPFLVIDANNYTVKKFNRATSQDNLPPGTACYQVTHGSRTPCHGDNHICPIKEIKKTKKPIVVEHIHGDNDGNSRVIEVHGFPILNDTGDVVEIIEYFHDISERKQAEEALIKSEKEYQQLFNGMINGFALHELVRDDSGNPIDYKFLQINPAFEKLTGLKAADLIGKKAYESLPGLESFWLEKYSKVAITGEPVHFENYSTPLAKYFEVTAYRPAENQFACIITNITERRRMQEDLRIAYEQLVEEQVELRRKNKTLKKTESDLRSAYEKLITEQVALRAKNIALKEVLGQIESDKKQLQIRIQNKVERIIKPIIRNLEPNINTSSKRYFKLLENSLNDVTKPFNNRLEKDQSILSPRELEVCNMVKDGMSSKDIASSLNISVYTVHNQRRSIRKKLEINKKTNLVSLLQSN